VGVRLAVGVLRGKVNVGVMLLVGVLVSVERNVGDRLGVRVDVGVGLRVFVRDGIGVDVLEGEAVDVLEGEAVRVGVAVYAAHSLQSLLHKQV